ncbi:MAG: hypothetical protein V7631_644 [Massilia sp.]|jgi:hypothetical protein
MPLTLGPRETMRGLRQRVGGKMVFQLRSYRPDDRAGFIAETGGA